MDVTKNERLEESSRDAKVHGKEPRVDQDCESCDGVHRSIGGLCQWLSSSLRGSLRFSIDIEHSLALVLGYCFVGAVLALSLEGF